MAVKTTGIFCRPASSSLNLLPLANTDDEDEEDDDDDGDDDEQALDDETTEIIHHVCKYLKMNVQETLEAKRSWFQHLADHVDGPKLKQLLKKSGLPASPNSNKTGLRALIRHVTQNPTWTPP